MIHSMFSATDAEIVPVLKIEAGVQCAIPCSLKVDVGTQFGKVRSHTTVQCSVKMDEKNTTHDITYNHKSTQSEVGVPPFRLEQIQDDDKFISFYSGFPSFLHLLACYQFLGAAVATLSYGPSKTNQDAATACGMGHHHILSPINEVFNAMSP